MNAPLIASLAVAGLLAGWAQRAVIVCLADPAPAADPPPGKTRPEEAQPPRTPPALLTGCVTAVLLGALAARVHPGLVLAAAAWLVFCAVPLAFVDAAVRRLPDRLTGSAYAGTGAFLVLAAAFDLPGPSAAAAGGHWASLLRAALGGLALAGFYLLILVISPSGMGLGDVKLAASLGTLLAWFGWRVLIAGACAGFLLGGLAGVAVLLSGRATRKQPIPFGPFMIAGAVLALLTWPAG